MVHGTFQQHLKSPLARGWPLLSVLWALGCCHCTAPATSAGRLYLAKGQTALAWEYFQAAVADAPADQSLKDEAILAQGAYTQTLSQTIKDLMDGQVPLSALKYLVSLEDALGAAKDLHLAGEGPETLVAQKRALTKAASRTLQTDLDTRLARSLPRLSDLATCNSLRSLACDDEDINRTCDRLLTTFKRVAVLVPASGTHAGTGALLPYTAQAIVSQHPELLAAVNAGDATQNAQLEVFIDTPKTVQTDWTLERRDAFHKFVPRLDAQGRQVTETVTVAPTQADIDEAKKNKAPAPKPTTVVKTVWDLVAGEYRHFRAQRTVTVPYRAILTDLRQGTLASAVAGELQVLSESRYHTYTGSPRGRESPEPAGATRREDAPALRSENELLNDALQSAPATISAAVIHSIE